MNQKIFDKSKFNIIIDTIMFLLIMPIAGIGFLIRYVLVPGYKKNEIYGSNVDLEFLGKTNHEWGTIHLLLSIALLVLLVLHIVFHWKMIIGIFKKIVPITRTRKTLYSLLSILALLSISFPMFINPDIVEKEALYRNRKEEKTIKAENANRTITENSEITNKGKPKAEISEVKQNQHANHKIEVFGSQTLQYVADKYNVPVSTIAADLNLPKGLSEEKLGRLKRQYPFTMDDVRASVAKYKAINKKQSYNP